MTPYYEHAGITIWHGDCREIAPGLDPSRVTIVLTDPQYGIGWVPRVRNLDAPDDSSPADVGWLLELGRWRCIWGGNYFADQLPPSPSWRIWLKRPAGFDEDPRTYSPSELAWTDYGGNPRTKTIVWDGGKRQGAAVNRTFCHPSQKPVELMRWCIIEAPSSGGVLDPFMGSGTTLDAAKSLGLPAIGIEIQERYCEIAAERLSQEVLPLEAAQ